MQYYVSNVYNTMRGVIIFVDVRIFAQKTQTAARSMA